MDINAPAISKVSSPQASAEQQISLKQIPIQTVGILNVVSGRNVTTSAKKENANNLPGAPDSSQTKKYM